MREGADGRTGLVFVASSALVALVVGLVLGLPWPVTVLLPVAAGATGLVVLAMSAAGTRRDILRWQDAAVDVTAWAVRHDGRSDTSVAGLAGYAVADSRLFTGGILAAGRLAGFDVGVACFEVTEGQGAVSPHTAVLVRLPSPHPPMRGTPGRLPARAESVQVDGYDLRMVFRGWPPAVDLDLRVGEAVAVARGL
ncbi:hypothetical protein [Actinophytocola oryzae]|uniref:Uncharacterized protein n=1 Tax=Actinophytocola oryzae TaxID=502181 RepID=A0A4R7V2I3_9PSEU|nr:hypothetical protein [Actinophytocola oryzae]TDV43553.1 hypothetical protein CLV71_11515 [Actinophytocola oryzae]